MIDLYIINNFVGLISEDGVMFWEALLYVRN